MSNKSNPWRDVAVIGSMGMEIILLTVGGAWLGKQVDNIWQTQPAFLIGGLFLGLGLGFYGAYVTMKKLISK